jgi:hypothetical protein
MKTYLTLCTLQVSLMDCHELISPVLCTYPKVMRAVDVGSVFLSRAFLSVDGIKCHLLILEDRTGLEAVYACDCLKVTCGRNMISVCICKQP